MCFVNWTPTFEISRRLACVNAIPMNASFEKPRASIAAVDAIVFARASVATHLAGNIQKTITYEKKKGFFKKMLSNTFKWI